MNLQWILNVQIEMQFRLRLYYTKGELLKIKKKKYLLSDI